jgi:hypothetical protein
MPLATLSMLCLVVCMLCLVVCMLPMCLVVCMLPMCCTIPLLITCALLLQPSTSSTTHNVCNHSTHNVPEIVASDRQQPLAIRWILGAAFKRRISNRMSSDKCLSAEIPDAYRKRGIARKKRDDPHEPAPTNRSFVHFTHYLW